jgi:hypothetical protein
MIVSHCYGGWQFKIKVLVESVPGEGQNQMADLSLVVSRCLPGVCMGEGRQVSHPSFCNNTDPTLRIHPTHDVIQP